MSHPRRLARPSAPLRLPPGVASRIRDHGRASRPLECCGLLLGSAHEPGGVRRVTAAIPVANRDPAPRTRFRLAPEDVFAAHRDAARRGLAVVGFYHSHPSGDATPSDHDRALAWPGHVYAIVAPGALRAFVAPARGAAFEELAVIEEDA